MNSLECTKSEYGGEQGRLVVAHHDDGQVGAEHPRIRAAEKDHHSERHLGQGGMVEWVRVASIW